jgi:hypothetical protein
MQQECYTKNFLLQWLISDRIPGMFFRGGRSKKAKTLNCGSEDYAK